MIVIENHKGVNVLRDDLPPGGTKSIFMNKILDQSKKYFVYASPVYGGFQIALSIYCKSIGKQAVIFCAKRNTPHENSIITKNAGGMVYQVPFGYLSNCQSKAKEFVKNNDAQYIEFGANYPAAITAIAQRMKAVSEKLGSEPGEIFCAAGSGTLLKGIIEGTTTANIKAVQVGAAIDFKIPGRVKILFQSEGTGKNYPIRRNGKELSAKDLQKYITNTQPA